MKVALICPADFTVFLCCKWIIKHIQDKGHEVLVLSPLGIDKYYLKEIKKFNVEHIEIRMNRHTANVNMKGPIKDLRLNKYSRGNNFNMGFQVTLIILTQS